MRITIINACVNCVALLAMPVVPTALQVGLLPSRVFAGACASLGVVLSPMEQALVDSVAQKDGSNMYSYAAFCGLFHE